jgi:hypothetical protein
METITQSGVLLTFLHERYQDSAGLTKREGVGNDITHSLPPLFYLTAVLFRWGRSSFHRREAFQDFVGVRGALGHQVRYAGLQNGYFAFDVQLGAAFKNVAYSLVGAAAEGLGFARLFVFPEA